MCRYNADTFVNYTSMCMHSLIILMGNACCAQITLFTFRAVVQANQDIAALLASFAPYFLVPVFCQQLLFLEGSLEESILYVQSTSFCGLIKEIAHHQPTGNTSLQIILPSDRKQRHQQSGKIIEALKMATQCPNTAIELVYGAMPNNTKSHMHALLKCYQLAGAYNLAHSYSATELDRIGSEPNPHQGLTGWPDKFIQVNLHGGITINSVKGLESLLLQQIPLDEEIVLKIIKKKSTEWTGVSNMVRKAFEEGRSEAVDLLVNDIYGQNCDTIGLPGKIIASSLGKLAKSNESHFEVSDVARALTIALAINIANILGLLLTSQESQTAVLVSNELHNDYFYSLLQSILSLYAPKATIWFLRESQFLPCLERLFAL